MDATPPPELADHEKRITLLENAVNNLSCELQSLRTHMDARFEQLERKFGADLNTLRIELRAEFQAQLHEAIEKLRARMDAQYHMMIGLQVVILLALVALVAA